MRKAKCALVYMPCGLDRAARPCRLLLHLVGTGGIRHSRNGRYGTFGLHQSALPPVNLTTLPHFSVSSAISLPKSAGEPASTVPPRSASRVFMLGSARPALISLLSLSTISAGVAFGAPTPYQLLASSPGTNAATVGMSCSRSERVAAVTASARSLPALIYPIDEIVVGKKTCTCPASRSLNAGPPPR